MPLDLLLWMPGVFGDPRCGVGTDPNLEPLGFAPGEYPHALLEVLFEIKIGTRFEPLIKCGDTVKSIELEMPYRIFVWRDVACIGDNVQA